MITLRGRVTNIRSRFDYADRVERLDIKPVDRAQYWAITNLRNTLGAMMDQEIEVIVQPVAKEASK